MNIAKPWKIDVQILYLTNEDISNSTFRNYSNFIDVHCQYGGICNDLYYALLIKYNMDRNDPLSEENKIPFGHNRTNGAVYPKINFKVEICSVL